MKVALVTSIPYGGPVEHAVLLARDLVALGVEVSAVACMRRSRRASTPAERGRR